MTLLRLSVIGLVLSVPALAASLEQDKLDAQEYHHCLDLARVKPDDGYEESLAWSSLGGGEPAAHCAAIARIGQKQYADGAKRLEDLARASHQEAHLRAEMLAQAAQAWLLDGNVDRADADQRAALVLVPDHPDILIDHAITLAQVHHYDEAAAELTKVINQHPDRIDALTLRASARRYLNDREGAKSDIARALGFDPGNPDALVERGILRRLDGDDVGARADWLAVVNLGGTSAAADEARRNLELLDVPGAQTPAK